MKKRKSYISENIKWIEDFSKRINLPEECIREIICLYRAEYKHIDKLKRKKFKPGTCAKIILKEKIIKKDEAHLYLLTAVLLKARDTLESYREKGISEDIFYETMKDITIWSENFRKEKGFTGIENIGWIQNHLNCKIFKLGRLQFQPFIFYQPPYVKQQTGIKIGSKVLNVHIPQGEKLLKEDCEKSFALAEKFFTGFPYKAFICDSWLLCESNKEFMKEDSNIIRFAEMFEILGSSHNSKQPLDRIFGKEEKNPQNYPENTSLQKQCKAYILSGGKPGTGFGIIRKNSK